MYFTELEHYWIINSKRSRNKCSGPHRPRRLGCSAWQTDRSRTPKVANGMSAIFLVRSVELWRRVLSDISCILFRSRNEINNPNDANWNDSTCLDAAWLGALEGIRKPSKRVNSPWAPEITRKPLHCWLSRDFRRARSSWRFQPETLASSIGFQLFLT